MAAMWPSSRFIQICLFIVLCYVPYRLHWELTVGSTRRRQIKQNGCKLPAKLPTWDPFFGVDRIAHSLKKIREHRLLEDGYLDLLRLNRSTVRTVTLDRDIVITHEPENIKTILATNFKSWGIGELRKDLVPMFGNGIFTRDGEAWQHSRDMLRPSFMRSQVADLQLIDRHVAHLIRAIPRDGSTIDLQPLFFQLSLDTSTEFLLGESTDTLVPENHLTDAYKFAEAFNRCAGVFSDQDKKWGLLGLFLPWPAQFKRDCRTMHEFVDSVITKALANDIEHLKEHDRAANRHVFLHDLISETTNKLAIRAELLNILVAGRDTTASLLSNVWFFLSKRRDIWSRLQKEVLDLPNNTVTYEDLKGMRYLRALLNESLRLHPILPANARQAMIDTTLPLGGGEDETAPVFVRKGQLVMYNTYNMHRRKDIYGEDAEEFSPERWIDNGAKALRPGWGYLPFNGGPRICIGQQFALALASYVTVRLVQEFSDIESRDPEPWRESLKITCIGLGGCKIGLTPRNE